MFPILENLRGFFSSRPPLVVFMICLASFAIALITFAYIVKAKEIPNPDVKMDWNTFLNTFSKLEMCLPVNASDREAFTNSSGSKIPLADLTAADVYHTLHEVISKTINSPPASALNLRVVDKDHSITNSLEKKSSAPSKSPLSLPSTSASVHSARKIEDKYFNLTIAMNVELHLNALADARIISDSVQYISLVKGRQMTFKGSHEDSELAVTLTFPFNLTASTCQEWSGKTCTRHTVIVCVNFQGPVYLFPRTQLPSSSDLCYSKQGALAENLPVRMMAARVVGQQFYRCEKGIQIRPSFSFDDSLTVMLSLNDRSIINLHLMRTSYFLFVMVVTFFCYAMIKGRPTKLKTSHIPYVEKVPMHP